MDEPNWDGVESLGLLDLAPPESDDPLGDDDSDPSTTESERVSLLFPKFFAFILPIVAVCIVIMTHRLMNSLEVYMLYRTLSDSVHYFDLEEYVAERFPPYTFRVTLFIASTLLGLLLGYLLF